MSDDIAHARSFLFVPADRPERYAKALRSGADAVIFDLEDAVAPSARGLAHEVLRSGWHQIPPDQRPRVLVRVNGASTPWYAADVALAAQLTREGLGGIVLPKADSAQDLTAVARACPGAALVPLVETAEGLHGVHAIACAPQVSRLALGHLDLQLDLGMACGVNESELLPARWSLVLASRLARLAPPVDGVTTAIGCADLLARDAERSHRLGFGGKLCIHPSQVDGVHAAMTPHPDEINWAIRVLAAAQAEGGAARAVDGKMVDAPVMARAERTLALVRRHAVVTKS